MSWKIGMPNLGHTMEEGKVAEWLKSVGDSVRKGEVIAVVESDKASFDIESPADGVLAAIDAAPGATVLVGGSIGAVAAPGEDMAAAATQAFAYPSSRASSSAPSASEAARSTQSAGAAREIAAQPGVRSARGRISPAARALADELGVDWQQIAGTGDGGLITRDDVRAHSPAKAANRATPLSPMRRAIAEATERSWRTIPHVALHSHADVTSLVKDGSTGLTAAITRACALALGEHPAFNGWLGDDVFTQAQHADVALAVATPAGLVTAVVREAETKSIAELGEEIGALADSARNGRLDGARMSGASFTVSSLGRWGVEAFAPIIAAPQVAILGVGKIDRVAREAVGAGVRFASELDLTLVFDHRANDGVQAAQLLAAIVGYLEQPVRLELNR